MNSAVTKSSFECFATKQICKNRRSTSCVFKNINYVLSCLSCLKQGIGPTVDWKPTLWNYKSHTKKKLRSCDFVNHFIDVCSDKDVPSKNFRFNIIDQLNNTKSLPPNEIHDLLLQKERFWISILLIIHKGLNSTHDWNRNRQTECPN